MKDIYVKERNDYNELLRKKKAAFDEKRIQKLKAAATDPKTFWQTIRTVNRKAVVYNDISTKQWFNHFSSVFKFQDSEITTEENIVSDDLEPEPLFNEAITKEEVIASIRKLKTGKSAGPDKILGEMLKCANDMAIGFLVEFFNVLFLRGIFPKEWSKSIIVPIFKKGDVNEPDNYRGIALTSIVSKVYTHILNARLSAWAEREEKIVEEQAGFRAGYSTIDHVFTLYAIVQKHLMKNLKLYVAFVDFKKAFDSVNRHALWSVLRKSGVHGKLYFAVKAVYESVKACVRDKSEYSEYFECPQGVKQGCLLSPLMFSFFVNELAVELSNHGKHGIQLIPGAAELFLLLFADDVILLSNTVVGLQNQLNLLKSEADRLHLTVNLNKTKIMVFRMGGHLARREKWLYGKDEVEVVNSYQYLGMTFTTKLSLSVALSSVCVKGRRGVMEILKSLRKLNTFDPSIFWKLFDAQVEPMITYAAEVWGLSKVTELERVHTFAIKRFLNVPLHSSNVLVYGETGRQPLYVRTYVKCIKYWLKLTRLPSERICKQAYEMLFLQHEAGHCNWVSKVRDVLCEHGFGFAWMFQGVGLSSTFISEFKERLTCNFYQNLHSQVENDSKYRWYFSFKSAFQAERYLSFINNKWHRNALVRFRIRACGLKGQKIWHVDQDHQEDTKCPLCGLGKEDEAHLLFKCPAYNDLRQQYRFLDIQDYESVTDKVSHLLASEDTVMIKMLAKYLAHALKYRKDTLEMV